MMKRRWIEKDAMKILEPTSKLRDLGIYETILENLKTIKVCLVQNQIFCIYPMIFKSACSEQSFVLPHMN